MSIEHFKHLWACGVFVPFAELEWSYTVIKYRKVAREKVVYTYQKCIVELQFLIFISVQTRNFTSFDDFGNTRPNIIQFLKFLSLFISTQTPIQWRRKSTAHQTWICDSINHKSRFKWKSKKGKLFLKKLKTHSNKEYVCVWMWSPVQGLWTWFEYNFFLHFPPKQIKYFSWVNQRLANWNRYCCKSYTLSGPCIYQFDSDPRTGENGERRIKEKIKKNGKDYIFFFLFVFGVAFQGDDFDRS